MVENVVHHDNTVVMSAHSVGKTRLKLTEVVDSRVS